jgi:hypothetical protein
LSYRLARLHTQPGGLVPWNRFSGSFKVYKFGPRSLDGGGVSAREGNYLDADLLENHSGQSPVWARPPSTLPRHRKSALADQINADRWGQDTLLRKSHLCIPRKGIARPQSQFPHSCVCERFIYSQAQITDGSWEYINRSQTHECGNWD